MKCLYASTLLCLLLSHAAVAENGPVQEAPVTSAVQDPSPQPTFAIWEFRIAGNTLLQNTTIELALTPYLGPQGSLDKVQQAASALEKTYRDAGYPTVLVNIPEQDVRGGQVQLDVVEGRIARVRVSGSRYFLPSGIKKEVSSLQPGQPMHIPSFQADMNRLNSESADLRVTPVLKPGRTPGTVEVDLRVKDKLPLHGSFELNNYNSLDTTDSRVAANISYDNLWQQHHSISLQYQNSPEETAESRVLAGTYILPVVDDVSRLAIYGVSSKSEVSTLSDLTVLGNGKIYGARFVRALGSTRDYVHSLSLGLDSKDFDESVNLVGSDSRPTPIKYSILTGLYNGSILHDHSTLRLGFSMTMGLRDAFGGGDSVEFDTKRFNAQPNFAFLQSTLKYQYRFENDWRLNARSKLQLADSPLISNEQFSAGGASSVRGYYESQILGDDGVVLSAEIETPDWLSSSQELRFRCFVDGAWMRIQQPLDSQEDESAIAGAGIGLDYRIGKNFTFVVDSALALRDATQIDEGDIRTNGSLLFEF